MMRDPVDAGWTVVRGITASASHRPSSRWPPHVERCAGGVITCCSCPRGIMRRRRARAAAGVVGDGVA
ncbi:hypothetical protein MARPU_13320 [Marichromatium purpuratum 984]|uniref:Uncharacterized protein n=1 Tax=Marichromatium purpuratum 984 TaxID=765910 RepID=W0E7V9_MARPU|nr:hypothetical protein MARPU_13320 [Marichromatium purpuratum 984]